MSLFSDTGVNAALARIVSLISLSFTLGTVVMVTEPAFCSVGPDAVVFEFNHSLTSRGWGGRRKGVKMRVFVVGKYVLRNLTSRLWSSMA